MNRSHITQLTKVNREVLSQIWREHLNDSTDTKEIVNDTLNGSTAKSSETGNCVMNDDKTPLVSENMDRNVFQNRSSAVVFNERKDTGEKRCTQILVTDFPCGTSTNSLLVYFQKFGEIVDIIIPEIPTATSIAVITFKFAESVEKVLTANEPFIFRGCLLKVTPLGNNSQTSKKREPSYFTIKASNLPKEIPFQEVYNIFKQYGRIAEPPNICLKETEHEALIPYESINDAERLIEETKGTLLIRYDTYTLRLEKAFEEIIDRSDGKPSHAPFVQPNVPVSEYRESEKETKPIEKTNIVEGKAASEDVSKVKFSPQESESSAFIQVRNVNKFSSSDLLSLYFKSKRSGNEGGAVKHIDFKGGPDLAIVEFETTVSAERVLSFKKDGRHTLEDQIIYVSKLPPLCKNRIFLRNIPQWITLDGLTLYLESKAHNEVTDVKFNDGNDGAIITFAGDIEIDSMRLSFIQRPYKDGSNQTKPEELELVPVVYPDAVLVYIGGCSQDSIEIPLEDYLSKLAPGFDCSVRYSINNAEKEMWLVCFENYKAVALFPDNFELTINGKKCLVAPYFDCLGWRPKNGKGKADFLREHSLAAVYQDLSLSEADFLSSTVGRNYVEIELEKKGWQGVFNIEPNSSSIRVVAENKEKSQQMLRFISDCMKTIEIEMDQEMLTAWEEKATKFLECNNNADIGNYFAWTLNKGFLYFTVATSKAESVKSLINAFFANNSIYEQTIVNAGIEGSYLRKFHETALMLKCSNAGTIKFESDGSIRMKGTKAQLGTLEADIKVLLTEIEVSEYIVNNPGMSKYFKEAGFTEISAISDRTRTLIVFDDELVKGSRQLENSVDSLIGSPINELELEGFVNGKIKVVVHRGDITAENVDAIVNAANEELKHVGGLAKSIVDKGGLYIQNECDKYIRKNGPLNVAGVFVSSAGGLPCEKIIHAVGPTYKDGRANEDRELKNVINNIIQIAIANRFRSVAIPAISTGVFGYPVEKAIPIIVNTAILSSAESDCLNEIRFVDTNETTVKKFIEELKRSNKFQKTIGSTNLPLVSAVPANRNRSNPVVEKQLYAQTGIQSPIKLVKDNIVNVAKYCDVIVNTTGSGTNDMLGSGAACKAIAAAAGQAYINDAKKRYPNGIGNLSLAVTEAGSLGCKRVFHISCPPWDHESSLNILTDKIFACLDETERQKLTSIAFPAIGTGVLRYPADLVANTMYNSVTAWFKGHPQCSLKTVIFVVFPADSVTVNAFEKEFAARNIKILEPLKSSPINDTVQMMAQNGSTMSAANSATLNGITVELIQKIDPKSNVECIISSLQEVNFNNGSLKKTVFPIESPKVDHIKWQASLEESLAKAAKIFTSVVIVVFENGVNTQIIGEKLLNIIKTHVTETTSNLSLIQIMVPESDFSLMCNCLSELFAQVKKKKWLQKMFDLFWPFNKDNIEGEATVSAYNQPQEEIEPNLKLHICGPKSGVGQALSMLDNISREKCPERTIIKPIIKELDDDAINKVRKGAERFGVSLHVDREQNKIKIKGFKAVEYRELLVETLNGLAEAYESQNQNHLTNVEWFKRQNRQQPWQLISERQTKLENEYKRMNGKGAIVFNFEDDANVIVDFDKMTVSRDNGQSILFYLKRRDVIDSIPLEWDYNGKLSTENEYVLVPLDSSSTEYNDIKTEVFKTAPAGTTITKIERVENPVRFHQYQALKRKLELSLPPNIVAERKLFHGTNGVNVPSVCTTGFDRGLAGFNAVAFGHGSYFARDFSYSMGYTISKTIFYAFVLTGRYTLGNTNMKTAPVLDATKATKYDSVVNDINNPSIFVVFTDNHAYPAYLITYA